MTDNNELKTAVLKQLCNDFVPVTISFQAAQRKRDNIRALLNNAIDECDGDVEAAAVKVRKELGGEETKQEQTSEPVQETTVETQQEQTVQELEVDNNQEPESEIIQNTEPVQEPVEEIKPEPPAESLDTDFTFETNNMPVDTPPVSTAPVQIDAEDDNGDVENSDIESNVDDENVDFRAAFDLDKSDDITPSVSQNKKKPAKKTKSAVRDEDIVMKKAMVPRSVETFLNSIFPSYTDANFGDKISAMAYVLSNHDCDEISQRARVIADDYEQRQKNKRGVTVEDISKSLVSLRGHILEILQISYETRAAAAYVELQRSYSRSGAPAIDNIDFFSEDMQKYLKRLHTLAERERRAETDARGREIHKSIYSDEENN